MNDVFQDILFGVEHDAFDDRLGRAMVQAWRSGACDEVVARLIRDRVRPLRTSEAFGQLSPFRKPRLKQGEVPIGLDMDREWIAYPAQWLTSGVLDISNTGGGKSNRVSFSALQLAALGVPCWLIDNYKRQFRHLRRKFKRLGVELVILRIEDWKFNLLQAGSCDPRTYLSTIVDLLVRVLELPPRARSILNHACHELYRQFGVWNGKRDAWPTLFDAYEWVHRHSELNAAAREAILDRLSSLLLSFRGAYRLGWNPIELAQHCVVLESRGADMGLNTQQRDWARLHLKPGMFIGQVAEGDWREPFLFTVPLLQVSDTVGDEEAHDSVHALDSLPVVPATEFAHWEPHHIVELSSQTKPLTDTELRYVQAVVATPGKPSSFYARTIGVSGKRAAEIRARLVKENYVREHELATGQRGRNAIVLEPLPAAFTIKT